MLKEFFRFADARRLAVAWLGLGVFLAQAGYNAYLKTALNRVYSELYDGLGEATAAVQSGDEAEIEEARSSVYGSLEAFSLLVVPAIFVAPIAKFLRSMWSLEWRLALLEEYSSRWASSTTPIEGVSQRIHEDTLRFITGINSALSIVLGAFFTLGAFVPILLEIGSEVRPRAAASLVTLFGDSWLVCLALLLALFDLAVALLVGRRLVRLEVDNQKVEAALRTLLVKAELDGRYDVRQYSFGVTLQQLGENYVRLFKSFSFLNTWLSLFEQFTVLLPYFLVVPLLFESEENGGIQLGSLMRLTHAFSTVFGEFNVVADSMGPINEFRSVLRRLSEFERSVSPPSRPGGPESTDFDINTATPTVSVLALGPISEFLLTSGTRKTRCQPPPLERSGPLSAEDSAARAVSAQRFVDMEAEEAMDELEI